MTSNPPEQTVEKLRSAALTDVSDEEFAERMRQEWLAFEAAQARLAMSDLVERPTSTDPA